MILTKKGFLICFIVLVCLGEIIFIDSFQALLLRRSPFIHYTEQIEENNYVAKGILVNAYHCGNETKTYWKKIKFACPLQVSLEEKNQYQKVIDNLFIDIELPKDWHYEEIAKEDAKLELKIYQDSIDRYASLTVTDAPFGVCGTGLLRKEITTEDGESATIGYYDGGDIWSYVSFSKIKPTFYLWNHGLSKEEADKLLEILQTIKLQTDFYITKAQENDPDSFQTYATYQNQTIYMTNNIEEFYVIEENKNTLKDYVSENFADKIKQITEKLNFSFSYDDGGTSVYQSQEKNITMILCNTLEQNKDIYIGDYTLQYKGDMCQNN